MRNAMPQTQTTGRDYCPITDAACPSKLWITKQVYQRTDCPRAACKFIFPLPLLFNPRPPPPIDEKRSTYPTPNPEIATPPKHRANLYPPSPGTPTPGSHSRLQHHPLPAHRIACPS